jgi:hypothetical protein
MNTATTTTVTKAMRIMAAMIAGVEGIHPAHAFNRVALAFDMVAAAERHGLPVNDPFILGMHHASNPSAATVALAERIAAL